MLYRFFKCKCGKAFHGFVEDLINDDLPTHECECGDKAELCLNDPDAVGTKLLFNYMER